MVTRANPTREAYYRVLVDALPARSVVVTALGNASYLWAALRDAPENFYLEDAMGLALPVALGLAVAQPDREVVVVEGDGGFLMHMGGLVTVAGVAPANLTVLLIDNGVHGASGGQALASPNVDFAALGRAAGLQRSEAIATEDAFRAARRARSGHGQTALHGGDRRATLCAHLVWQRYAGRLLIAFHSPVTSSFELNESNVWPVPSDLISPDAARGRRVPRPASVTADRPAL